MGLVLGEDLAQVRGIDDEGRVAVACVVTQVEHQVAGLLGDPCGGRVRGDTQDPDAAGGVPGDGEAGSPGQGDRVGVEEITGEDPFGLGP